MNSGKLNTSRSTIFWNVENIQNREQIEEVDGSSKELFKLIKTMLNNSNDRENLRAPEDNEVKELCFASVGRANGASAAMTPPKDSESNL